MTTTSTTNAAAKLHQRQLAALDTAGARYWTTVEAIAADSAALDSVEALDALDANLRILGRSHADLQHDVGLVVQLRALRALDARGRDAVEVAQARLADPTAARLVEETRKRADAAAAEAVAAYKAAEQEGRVAILAVEQAQRDHQRADKIERELVQRGYPEDEADGAAAAPAAVPAAAPRAARATPVAAPTAAAAAIRQPERVEMERHVINGPGAYTRAIRPPGGARRRSDTHDL